MVSEIVSGGIVPGAIEMMDNLSIRAAEGATGAGYPTDAGAALVVELDGAEAECEARFDQVVAICENAGADSVRVAQDEAERELIWRTRKAAFAAMGRIAPNYYVQDSVIPRTRLAEVLARIDELAAEHDLQVANVFHAGDGNLHPLVCYDGAEPGEAERAEELRGADRQGLRGRRRLDHRRARRGRRQEALHAGDVQRDRPVGASSACAAPSTRSSAPIPARSCPRRACAARCPGPTAGIRSSRPAWRSASDERAEHPAPGARVRRGRRSLREAGEAGSAVRITGGGTKLGWGGQPCATPASSSPRGARPHRRAQRRRPHRRARGRCAAGPCPGDVRRGGPDARARPAGRRRHGRRCRGQRRLRAAALALRRGARPRGGDARGALRRDAGQERRQGDQERGRLRPGQAVRRLVRHARRDPRGIGAPAPAAARHRHGAGRRRRPRPLGARRGGARRAPRSSTRVSTCAGRTVGGRC